MSNIINSSFHNAAKFIKPVINFGVSIRYASKKTGTKVTNKGNARPKHRGLKMNDGWYCHAGNILVTQTKTRFHPGLNVGFGRNGSLYALEHGKIAITCEKINPDYQHFWVRKNYAGRENQTIYKKHLNVIPDKQHDRFILKDTV